MMPQKERRRLLFASPVRATSARRRQDVRPCGNGRSCPFLPPARAAASSPHKALPPPLRRLTRAPLFRTLGFAGRAMAMPVRSSPAPPHGFVRELFKLRLFHGPGEPSADRAPAPQNAPVLQTQALLPLRAFVRCRKNREAFPKAAEAALLPRMFSAGRGTPHVGRSPAPWKMFFHRGRTDRSSNAV